MVDVRFLGILIILMSAIVSIILYDISIQVAYTSHLQCSVTSMSCTVYQHIPVESWLGFFMLAGMVVVGAILVHGSKASKATETHKAMKVPKNLSNEERKIMDIILKYEGTVFQSDLVRESGYSKVKVTRILDKLETKSMIERRRRGMANVIVLKQLN